MLRMRPQTFSSLYEKDVIAFGTGVMGKRLIPYLAQDPTIKLHGVTNSRITSEDDGTFLDTGLPLRSVQAWAKLLPDATILVTSSTMIDEIISVCRDAGFQNFQFITNEMMNALIQMEGQLALSQTARIMESLCLANELHDAHKAAFSEFKGCNKGKTVVVVGTGPTLQYYTQLPGSVHIGVNASFLKENLTLDYYFITHYIPRWCERLKDYDFIKFFGMNTNSSAKDQFPEYILEENGGRKFFSMIDIPGVQVHTDIAYYPLMAYNFIIFRAIHFALYTQPKKILLVGCDCSANGNFDGPLANDFQFMEQSLVLQWIDGYKKVKEFASIHYPSTKIISVNPVGLKGLFSDFYTPGYLEAHPEISCSESDLLQELDYTGE